MTIIFIFNIFILWIFNAPIRFYFYKENEKQNTVYFSFFIFMKKLKKELLKKIKINFMVIFISMSTRYLRASSCRVPWDLPLCNDQADIKNPLFRKQLMYFNVYIAGCYFQICFILIVNGDIKHTSRSSHREVFS